MSPQGRAWGMPGMHWPLLDDPSHVFGLNAFFLGLPQSRPDTLGACPCFLEDFSPIWGGPLIREMHTG